MKPLAQLRDIRKTYGTREVLHGVSLDVHAGEMHALLGANGSGKTTLVRVLTGSEQPDSGSIVVSTGGEQALRSPRDAREHGIRVVHQETPFIDSMSVAENIALKLGYRTGPAGIHWRAVHRFAQSCLAPLDLDIDPTRLAATLTASERGLIAMAIALGDGGPASTSSLVLVLDEATASIPEDEAEAVLRRVRALTESGVGVLMVTHRTREVRDFADHISVLYDGSLSYTGADKLSEDELVKMIVNRTADAADEPSRAAPRSRPAEPVLTVKQLRSGALTDIEFSVGRGEVLGVVGGAASGVEQVAAALAGLDPAANGIVRVARTEAPAPRTPRQALALGIALVPRDRLRQGAVGILSVFENVMLPSARGLRYQTKARKELVAELMERFDVVPRDPDVLVSQLSGGNQQKVIVGKWMARAPRVLILDDPTVGIDPGARITLFRTVREACERDGLAVLLLSSEPEQLSEHCDRVIAIYRGSIAETLTDEDLNEVRVARWASA